MGIKIPRDPTVEKLKLKSKAVKTQQSYDGDWLKFVQYSKTRFNADPLEVDGIQDAYNLTEGYLNWLHTDSDAIKLKGKSEKNNPNAPSSNSNNKSYKSSTIKRILASITYKYRINNFILLPICFFSFLIVNWAVIAFFYSVEFLQAAFLLFWPFIVCIILRLFLRQSIGALGETSFSDVFFKVKLFRRIAVVISSVSVLSSIIWGIYFNLKTNFF